MKKYVLFTVLFVTSIVVFGQADEEIFKVIIAGGNLDSALSTQNPPMSELEKDPYIFFQQENYPRVEKPQPEPTVRIISEASIVTGISGTDWKAVIKNNPVLYWLVNLAKPRNIDLKAKLEKMSYNGKLFFIILLVVVYSGVPFIKSFFRVYYKYFKYSTGGNPET